MVRPGSPLCCVHGLQVQTAEALAEYVHKSVC